MAELALYVFFVWLWFLLGWLAYLHLQMPDEKPRTRITGNYGDRATAIRTVDLTNPSEWKLISKAHQQVVRAKPKNADDLTSGERMTLMKVAERGTVQANALRSTDLTTLIHMGLLFSRDQSPWNDLSMIALTMPGIIMVAEIQKGNAVA